MTPIDRVFTRLGASDRIMAGKSCELRREKTGLKGFPCWCLTQNGLYSQGSRVEA